MNMCVTGKDHVNVRGCELLLDSSQRNHTFCHVGDVVHVNERLTVDMFHYGVVSHHEDVFASVGKCLISALFEEGHHSFGEAACRLVSAYIGYVGIHTYNRNIVCEIGHICQRVHALVKAHNGITVTEIGIEFGKFNCRAVGCLNAFAAGIVFCARIGNVVVARDDEHLNTSSFKFGEFLSDILMIFQLAVVCHITRYEQEIRGVFFNALNGEVEEFVRVLYHFGVGIEHFRMGLIPE